MTSKLLLIDFENVQQIDLSRLDEDFQIVIFVGVAQKSIPIDLVATAQKLGDRVEWQKIDANGSNALDFFIACKLGRVLEGPTNPHCIILSKDKGFDPLLRYLNKAGLKSRRINSLMELDPKGAAQPDEPNYKRLIEVLRKSEKKSRPRKRKTLAQHISSIFQKKLPSVEVDRLIDVLFANKMITESNNSITYEF